MDTTIYFDVNIPPTLDCDQRSFNPILVFISNSLFHHNNNLFQLKELGKPCVFNQVQKSLLYQTPYLGDDNFYCPNCDNLNIIHRSCHFEVCQHFGIKPSKQVATNFSLNAIDVKHRHIVFTILEEIRFLLKIASFVNQKKINKINSQFKARKPIFYTLKNDYHTHSFWFSGYFTYI